VGRSDRGGIKALSKPFSKLLQKSRVLLQTFPNKALAVLWDFKGLQGFQTSDLLISGLRVEGSDRRNSGSRQLVVQKMGLATVDR
jgi:hypothetical protein